MKNRAILRARGSCDQSKTASGSLSASSASDGFSRTHSADGGGFLLKPKTAETVDRTEHSRSLKDLTRTAEPPNTNAARPRRPKHLSRGITRTQSAGDGLGAMAGAAQRAKKSNGIGEACAQALSMCPCISHLDHFAEVAGSRSTIYVKTCAGLGGLGSQRKGPGIEMEAGSDKKCAARHSGPSNSEVACACANLCTYTAHFEILDVRSVPCVFVYLTFQ